MKNSFSQQIDTEQISRIQSIPHLSTSVYHDLNIPLTIDFFTRRYVYALAKRFKLDNTTIVDCGAGYGWFTIAYLLAGGRGAYAVDLDKNRLKAAEEISKILSLNDRIEFVNSSVNDLPPSLSAEIFVSIETLEHIGKKNVNNALSRIKSIAKDCILITTPNKLFPVIAHDTQLPFVHWLPPRSRRWISRIFNRTEYDFGNEFLSPNDLNIFTDKFKSDATCLTFDSFEDYINHFPIYQPYGRIERNRYISSPPKLQKLYYRLVSKMFGKNAYWVMPSMTSIFIRK